jgi:hypothetical protein
LARDEAKRKKKEELVQLRRLEKLTAAYKKQQKEEAQRVRGASMVVWLSRCRCWNGRP